MQSSSDCGKRLMKKTVASFYRLGQGFIKYANSIVSIYYTVLA